MFRALITSSFARGFLGALAAVVLVIGVLLAIHLWSDHVALHTMLDYLNTHADKINKLP